MAAACPAAKSLDGAQGGLVFEDCVEGGQRGGKIVVIHFETQAGAF